MTLMTRWEPLREFSAMQDRINRMNRLFRESYSPEVPEEALTTTSYAPPVDIYEDEHNITLKLEVPGIDEKDIDVRIENTTLTVHGERKIEKEDKEENFRGGEGWHNNHHAHPVSARHGLAWYEIDVNYYGILLLQKLGLARHVKTASLKPAVEERVMAASRDAVGISIGEASHRATV